MGEITKRMLPLVQFYENVHDRIYTITRHGLIWSDKEIVRTERVKTELTLDIQTQEPPEKVVVNGIEYAPITQLNKTMKMREKKPTKPINWGKALNQSLKQEEVLQAVFCPRCLYTISGLLEKKPNNKARERAMEHYSWHFNNALTALPKVVTFKKKK